MSQPDDVVTEIRERLIRLEKGMGEDRERLIRLESMMGTALDQVRKTNGTVIKHDQWIYGRAPICESHNAAIKQLEEQVSVLDTYMKKQQGGISVVTVLFGVGGVAGGAGGLAAILKVLGAI
jgi:hypothetical protein